MFRGICILSSLYEQDTGGINMNFFITSGTMDFMESLRRKYPSEKMVAMHGKGNSLLVHETTGKSVFQTPMKYQVIDFANDFEEEGFFALNNITVSDEGRPIYEHWSLSHVDNIQHAPGIIAHRLLRPLDSNTYIILTQWSKKMFFDLWQDSTSYQQLLGTNKAGTGLEKKPHMFSSAPYVTTYKSKKDD